MAVYADVSAFPVLNARRLPSSEPYIRVVGIGRACSIKDNKQDPDIIQGFCQLEILIRKTALTKPTNLSFLLAFYHIFDSCSLGPAVAVSVSFFSG
jgi:hypothetical protein